MGFFNKKKKEVNKPTSFSAEENLLSQEDLMNIAGGVSLSPEEVDIRMNQIRDIVSPNN